MMQSEKKSISPGKKSSKSDRIIPSRYKQAALKKSVSKGGTPSHLSFKQGTRSDTSSEFDITPMTWARNLGPVKGSGFTSTPASDITNVPICDASYIPANQSVMPVLREPLVSAGVKKKLNIKSAFHNKTEDIVLPKGIKKKEVKSENQMTDAELDLLYARYVQATFLESRSKKSLAIKTANALENLHRLWSVNQIILQKDKFYERELNTYKFVKQQMEYCKKQKGMYESAYKAISGIITEYEELSESIECIRNKLYAPGVLFSADENFQEELELAINEYEAVLQSFLNTFIPDQSELSESAVLLEKLSSLIDELDSEIKRCSKLLSAGNYMIANESSLKIAAIQLKEQK